jgi:hypothetical protein
MTPVRLPAVRIVHVPTGISAIAEHRSQFRAKDGAYALLRARLWARAAGIATDREVCAVELPDAEPYPHDLLAHRAPIGIAPPAAPHDGELPPETRRRERNGSRRRG